MPSECGNLSFGTAKPDEDLLLMGVAQHGLWSSSDAGGSWVRLGSAKDPEQITNRALSILFDPDDSATFWESGVYNGSGIFKTTDDGKTFSPAGTVTHVDYVSVDFSDPRRKTLLASGHEQVHKLYLSTDSAASWREIGDAIPDEARVCPFPYVVDSRTFLLGCGSYLDGETGIYRSTDKGVSWTKVSDSGGGASLLLAQDGTMYWGSEGSGGITTSTDQGETWSEPVGVGAISIRGTAKPWELPDGRLAALSTQSVVVSADGGKSWRPVSPALPYSPQGFFYSAQHKAFYVYRLTCNVGMDDVPADGVMSFPFDYETK